VARGSLRITPAQASELVLLGIAIAVTWILVPAAADAWTARVATLGIDAAGNDAGAAARWACVQLTIGVGVLLAARAASFARHDDGLRVPLLLPAAVLAAVMGLVLHAGTVETAGAGVRAPGSDEFAQGILVGCVAAALVVAWRGDPADLARRLQPLLIASVVGVFAALAVVGSGPGASGTRINLGPVQPIEAVKPALVAFLAAYLGMRAAKLRWQRQRILGLRWPRPRLLIPAVLALLLTFVGLYAVGDLGPTLILSLVFLGMFYLASRSSGWALLGFAVVAVLLAVLALWPELAGGGRLATRMTMWRDPWQSGLTHGHQVGEGLWAIASGGLTGQGVGQNHAPMPPAAMTDLMLASLGEQLGFAGLAAYTGLVAAIVLSGLHVAARNRTPERVLLAAGLSLVVLVQWAVIAGGTLRLLPLTGVVVPFLSSGRSSMVVFLFMVGVLVRLSAGARERAPSDELDELRRGVLPIALGAAVTLAVGASAALYTGVVRRGDVAARGIVVRLADGTLVHRQNPRLLALAGLVRRGSIEDRQGRPIAHDPDPARPGVRAYPLGAAMGTLVGSHPSRIQRPRWALEERFDHHLRGYGERADAPRYADYGRKGSRLPSPDLRRFVPLLYLGPRARREALAAIDRDLPARSVRLSIDARLQSKVAGILSRRIADTGAPAAAAVVLDVDTGQVLARAQAPDLDPGDPAWQDPLACGNRSFARTFFGAYGPGADHTGLLGMFQAGSVAKLFTALAAARVGWSVTDGGCNAAADVAFSCTERDAQGPLFALEGWSAPIHDHHKDSTHGTIDVGRALAVSCNVYFGQLGLHLGPEPFRELARAGVEVGFDSERFPFEPGAAGSRQLASTAFGQGAMAMNVQQVARLIAAVGGGGVYRRCPGTLELGAACEEHRIVDDPAALAPILAGLRAVMTEGTGARLDKVPGVRIYGKTGTADAPVFRGEPFAPARRPPPPHSWFAALVEPEVAPGCGIDTRGRVAIAVVVPRGGAGSASAGPAAVEIARALLELGYLNE
jgi:cell division protein FtsW (lipid II flippase)